jgi:formamidopyrimidine-DNA glycosylase
MPELPEVETIRRGITPYLLGQTIAQVVIREQRLRWPIPTKLYTALPGQTVRAVIRRGKYLLVETEGGWIILHLGMSGSLRILPAATPAQRHDHVDLVLTNQICMRLRDPRRFGALLWTSESPSKHPLLAPLGPEPWDPEFNGEYLYRRAQGKVRAVKSFIMDSRTVVGIGNIYANESLFVSGIHPAREAGRISLERYKRLAEAIRQLLDEAIEQGGTTLRDFVDSQGVPGYFAGRLKVYNRLDAPCIRCNVPVRHRRLDQRSTYYCSYCQR